MTDKISILYPILKTNSTKTVTVAKKNPLLSHYYSIILQDYEDFFQSKETNTVFSFLRLPPVKVQTHSGLSFNYKKRKSFLKQIIKG